MFTAEHRDHVRDRVLDLARADPRITAGALTGSAAVGAEDEWSAIDGAFGIADGVSPDAVLHDWTDVLGRDFGVLDHVDLRSGSTVYRVFVLPSGLEVDVALTPQQDLGARGPRFHILFGGKPWQAEDWSGLGSRGIPHFAHNSHHPCTSSALREPSPTPTPHSRPAG